MPAAADKSIPVCGYYFKESPRLFNILMIVGVTATILPLDTREITILDLVMLFAGAFLLWLFSFTKKTMERWEGCVLFLIFVGYLTFLLV